ncbi:hypothetical protein EQ836_25005 [Ectopseudomonas mendocina]|uniref:Restriction endonuclease n=2 Tax=Ectopseudomonas TaxID=3236654 RepID=A0ABD7RQ27_ECTME|nr:hypothetical protein [Pseudomonas mendocina]TRO08030.1 hypothetical protein EQ829_24995 [Pseudomonas mendocina]TRO10728.1 hypothetical protein EQ836_25005 [Pseudomonas mendocina]
MSSLLLQAPHNPKFLADIGKYIVELELQIKRHSFFQAAKTKASLSARDSCDFFTQCIQAAEDVFASDLNSYSAMRWMYYLRRIPSGVFDGKLSSTGVNARALAEVYANRSTKVETATFGCEGFVFPINVSTLRHIAHFIAFIMTIGDLQVRFRLASKGFDYVFPENHPRTVVRGKLAAGLTFKPLTNVPSPLPRRVPNPVLESAVRIYDQRHDYLQQTFLGIAMSQVGLAHDNAAVDFDADVDITQAFWGLHDEIKFSPQKLLEGHPHAAIYGTDGKVLVRFSPTQLNLARLFELYRLPVMAGVQIDTNASLCLLVVLLGGRLLKTRRFSCLRVMELGYFIVEFSEWNESGEKEYSAVCDEIRKHLPQFQAPESFGAFSDCCLTFKGEVWPLAHGAPIRITNDYVCMDMWAASMGFLAWLQFPKTQGQVANERATKFEDVVQEVIDRTRWADEASRALRQRRLRVDGQALTDIDAIGSYDGTLLVVSCKSIPYTREYDRGVHNVIRNAASTVDNGVDYWARIVSQLEALRAGDNFDLTGYKQIVGVVCTPFPVYTGDTKSLSTTVGELRWACSLDELVEFLER